MTHPHQAPYFVERLGRDHQVKSRHQFAQLPITIGRAYDNDCIIDDPHVSPHHAIIELADESDAPTLRDLGSHNGTNIHGEKQAHFALDTVDFTLGHTRLRFRHANSPVPAAITQVKQHPLQGWLAGIIGLILIGLSAFGSAWIEAIEKFSFLNATLDVGVAFLVILLWCGGWALATRTATGNNTKFGRHIFIVACAIICIDLWNIVSSTGAYALSWSFLTRYSSHIIAAIGAIMVYHHLKTMNPQHKKRFAMMSVCIAVLGSGFMFINNYQHKGYLADELYMPHLLSPKLRLSADESSATFMEQAKQLKQKVDKARQAETKEAR